MQLKKILYIYSKLSQNYCYGKLEAEAKFNHPDFLLSTSHVRIQLKEIFNEKISHYILCKLLANIKLSQKKSDTWIKRERIKKSVSLLIYFNSDYSAVLYFSSIECLKFKKNANLRHLRYRLADFSSLYRILYWRLFSLRLFTA